MFHSTDVLASRNALFSPMLRLAPATQCSVPAGDNSAAAAAVQLAIDIAKPLEEEKVERRLYDYDCNIRRA